MMRLWISALLFTGSAAWAGNYTDKVQEMRDIVSANKNLSELVSMGENDQGVTIWGLKLTFPSKSLDKTKHLVVGTHHGNETHAATTSMEFARQIVEVFSNPDHKYFSELQNSEFFVFPVLNVTGYDSRRRRENNGKTMLDPNRDYPDPCVKKTNFQLKSTKALADYLVTEDIVGAVTIHGYIGTFTFPWGIFTSKTHSADHDDFMAWSTYSVVPNGYDVGTHKDVIYATAGAFEDYAYNELGVWAMLLEISRGADERKDAESLVRYFTQIPARRSADHRHNKVYCQKSISREDLKRSRP